MNNKKSLHPALLLLLGALVVAITLSAGSGAGSSKVASAAVPTGSGAAQAAVPSVPNANFTVPVVVRNGSAYDNRPVIAASQINGAVTLVWAQAPGGNDGNVFQSSNTTLGGPFSPQLLDAYVTGANEVMDATHDNVGRRHIVYWSYGPSGGFCDHYAVVETNGLVSVNEVIPGSCDNGTPRKLGGVAVDSNLTTHIDLGRNNQTGSILYWQRLNSGVYTVTGESVAPNCCPSDIAVAVSVQGVVMVAFKSVGISGTGSDIFTAVRLAPNNWRIDDISSECCSYCPNRSGAYLPRLAPDYVGGIRAVWADGRCDGIEQTDIYYREWVPGTGWEGQPVTRVVYNSGLSYNPAIAVDPTGESHLDWGDDTSSPIDYFRVFYSHGHGTSFSPVEIPFDAWAGNAYQKEPDIDYGAGNVHISFSSNYADTNKDGWYSYAPVVALPTATPVPTATPQPPPCPQERFKDVCPGNYYYTPTLNLNDAGIINGYNTSPPCLNSLWVPCFIPFNNATRSQMAKIVVLAANLPINNSGFPQFQDVDATNVFSTYIGTAYNNGVVGGYACGSVPSEPCVTPGNRPYFRPVNTITRGQVAKMSTIAFNITTPPNGQTFQDVPPGSPFYTYTEQIADLGIISGYPCGGATEPCVLPNNRPYFRPNNPITRGQAAKILDAFRQLPTATPTMTATATTESTMTATTVPTSTSTTVAVPTDTPIVVLPTDTPTSTPGLRR